MQAELLKKKREIIETFLKNGVLINSETLNEINDYHQVDEICSILKSRENEDAVISLDLNKIIEELRRKKETTQTKEELKDKKDNIQEAQQTKDPREKVKVTSSYKDVAKKRDIQDFIDHFNVRYKLLEKILKQHQELQSTISISKLQNKKDKENIALIGMVVDRQTTKNGNLLIKLEDPTGRINVIVNKNKPDLLKESKNLVHDEVIGILGVNFENVVFANNIVWPDIPMSKELKKADEEKYAIFLSDMHVGSSKFLPDDFEKFLKWINCEMGNEQQRHIARNVEYIFIAGDLVDGVGIYPEQDKELEISDIYEQYRECARLLDKIPKHIPLIICPGNHDALRISEPQPPLSKDYAKPLHELTNAIMVSNPSYINIHATPNHPGFDVLMYHGYSFDYFIAAVDSLRNQGGYDRPDLIMKFLLKRRHLAPSHLSTLYIPDAQKDPNVIDKVPDFFLSGHIHKSSTSNYRNITLICGSCWQAKTLFQEKVGHNPEPSRVPIVNLKTRDVKILKFGQ